jgi:hypothetical protein
MHDRGHGSTFHPEHVDAKHRSHRRIVSVTLWQTSQVLKVPRLGSKLGTKSDKAAQWSIPIVNHTWLEDCFVRWQNLSVGQEKYVRFSPTCDFSGFLGDKGMGRTVILDDAEHGVHPRGLGALTDSVVDENDLGTDSPRPRVKDEAEDAETADSDVGETEEDNDSNHSTTEAEKEESNEEQPSSKSTGVHIMTTKVQVSEDTKKVRLTFKPK